MVFAENVKNPLNFLRTGYYYRSYGKTDYRDASGVWWSITNNSPTHSFRLDTAPTNVNPQNSNYRGSGFAVRCVVREG